MYTSDDMLQTTRRTQQLRAEAQRVWWQAQTARQQLANNQQYRELLGKHHQLIVQIHQMLTDLERRSDDTADTSGPRSSVLGFPKYPTS